MRRKRSLARALFSAAVAAAMGFGATQALAAPADPSADTSFCRDDLCETFCQAIGFLGGWCVNGDCFCYID